MGEYTYKRPRGYREKDGKILSLPMLEPKCMKCGRSTERNYYHAINNKTGEYGYLCSNCVEKMELSNKDASKKR